MGRVQVLRVKERFEYGWGVHAGQNLGTFRFARKVPFWAKIRAATLCLLKIPRIVF